MKSRSLLLGLWFLSSPVAAAAPLAFPGLAENSYTPLSRAPVKVVGSHLQLEIHPGRIERFRLSGRFEHPNGDSSLTGHGDGSRITATLGPDGVFGQLLMDGERYALTTDRDGTWLVELPMAGVTYNLCGTPAPAARQQVSTTGPTRTEAAGDPLERVIDVLLIYNQALANRYPGDLLATRLNHYIAIGNQVLANSDISLGLRIVGMEQFNYRNDNANSELLADMVNALQGMSVAGLAGLQQRRDALGADLVIMIRPHDIEVRGSCGVAYFPDNEPALGVNVVSDGMSSWSLCLDDVLIHEVGHNLGAGHQAGAGGGAYDPRGAAFVNPGQYSTVMSSFGTGRPDRFRGLPVFSNPQIQCGGQACGSALPGQLADNAAVIRSTMTMVSAYRATTSALPLPAELARSANDSDADGMDDWQDHFPFDAFEQYDTDLDSTGDVADLFPLDATEQFDLDGDAIGDNADPDDDGDGVPDGVDAFPLNAFESADTDGDGVGDQADALPTDPFEARDDDLDGIGNNADEDDDDDGIEDFELDAEDLLVVSVGNSRVLRFDAATGESRGVEVPPWDSLLTFQTDLAYRPSDHTLVYLGDSSLRRLDLLDRKLLGVYVPAYDDLRPLAPQLGTGFPTGIAAFDESRRVAVSLMDNTRIGLFRGQQLARNETVLNWSVDEGESLVDAVGDGDGTIFVSKVNRRLYRGTAAGVHVLGPLIQPWMGDPKRMALTDDGRLLISDRARNGVVAVDAASGVFLGDLATLWDQGYSNPTGVAVTRAGELLVASADQHVILRFDAGTGEFLGELVGAGDGGMSRPHAMVLVPRLADRFHADPDRVIRPNPGLWFDRRTEGRGFDIQVHGRRLSVIWYTYDGDGSPVWYLAAGELVGHLFQADLLEFRLSPAGSVTFETAGTVTMQFESERRAAVTWSIGEHSGAEALEWIVFTFDVAEQDHTGLWGRADGPGWGISLAQQGEVTVAIAYIYAADGRPRWVISDPFSGAAPLLLNMNASFSTTLCPGCSEASEYEFLPAGTMALDIPLNATWISDVSLPAPLTGEWLLDQVPIKLFSEPSVRPR